MSRTPTLVGLPCMLDEHEPFLLTRRAFPRDMRGTGGAVAVDIPPALLEQTLVKTGMRLRGERLRRSAERRVNLAEFIWSLSVVSAIGGAILWAALP